MDFTRRLSTVLVSFLLLYSAVWPLVSCLWNIRHSADGHAHSAASGDLDPGFDLSDSTHGTLRCSHYRYDIGPRAQFSFEPEFQTSFYENPLSAKPFAGSITPNAIRDSQLRAFFAWFPSFSSLSGLPIHLFLSILRL